MAQTQAERLENIDTKLELLVTQQRTIIMQNDKILEFQDAVYTAMAQEAQEPPAEPDLMPSAHELLTGLKDLKDDEGERPKASRSWGRDAD